MVLGSHNSWSYLTPKQWWAKLIAFTARCQHYDIQTQYEKYNARFFDLRLKFGKQGEAYVVHNNIIYNIKQDELADQLQWLDLKGDVIVKVTLDVRTKKDYTYNQVSRFREVCCILEEEYTNICFVGGQNIYNGHTDYDFRCGVSIDGKYSSVTAPKLIDDWIPILYAKLNNKKNIAKGTDKNVLLIDFVDIQ